MTDILHLNRISAMGNRIEGWCGCGWVYVPRTGTRIERVQKASARGKAHVKKARRE